MYQNYNTFKHGSACHNDLDRDKQVLHSNHIVIYKYELLETKGDKIERK